MDENGRLCDLEVPEGLFKDVKFYLIGSINKNIEDLLNKGGAKRDFYLSEMVTHAIAEDDTEDDFSQAKDLFEIPVVNSQWVVLSIKCGCLLPINGFNPEGIQIFAGVVACPTKLSREDSKAIWAMVKYHGGNCQLKLNKEVTHLIAGEAAGAKYDRASLLSNNEVKIVNPDWVLDCVAQQERLSEKCYHPRLLLSEDEVKPSGQITIKQEEGVEPMLEESDPYGLPMSPPMSTATTSTNLIFKSDSTRAKEALARMVNNRISQGGKEKLSLDPALLMKNQMNFAPPLEAIQSPPPAPLPPPQFAPPPIRAPLSPRLPGSPRGAGSPRGPRSPRVRGQGSPRGSPRGHLRNITNSADGPVRLPKSPRGRGRGGRGSAKISQLVSSLNRPLQPFLPGPQPPHPNFPQVMPTADLAMYYGHDPSESIPEDLCLLGCVFYVTDYHKYLDPQEMDNWKQAIELHGGQVDDSYSNRVTHVLCEHQKSDVFQLALRDGKRVITAHWLNDCLLMKKMQPPWLALHFPSVYGADRPCKNQIICVTNFEGDDRNRVKHMIGVMGAKYTGYMTHANSVVVAKFPAGVKFNKACEWRIPVVNIQWLNDILLGDLMALKLPVHTKYQQFNMEDPFKIAERWRVGHLLEGWKIPIKVSKDAWKRFNPSQLLKSSSSQTSSGPGGSQPETGGVAMGTEADQEGGDQGAGGQKRKADDVMAAGGDVLPPEKRQRPEDRAHSPLAEQHLNGMDCPVVLMTGIPKSRTELLSKQVQKLNGSVTKIPKECTHLVVNCLARTVKFFASISVAKYIVTPDWISQSAKAGKFLDEADFLLQDEKAEAMFSFKLQESLRRAREKKLFSGMSFYVTPSVNPGCPALKEIIENSGGKLFSKRPSVRVIANSLTPQGKPSFIVITCENDFHLCSDLIRKKIAVHNAEFILTGLVRQKVDYRVYRYDL